MLHRLSAAALLTSLLALTANAAAETVAASKAGAAPEVRRDAHGVKGISPFWEALKRGDSALFAQDLEAAIVAYRDALSKEPQNALGQYRLGEAQVLKGDLPAADEAFSAGLRVVAASNVGLKAKLQFALADLHERQKAYPAASVQWAEYVAFSAAQTAPAGFPASGAERKNVVEAWEKLSADSLAVKARIEKGVQAADEAVRKSSQ